VIARHRRKLFAVDEDELSGVLTVSVQVFYRAVVLKTAGRSANGPIVPYSNKSRMGNGRSILDIAVFYCRAGW